MSTSPGRRPAATSRTRTRGPVRVRLAIGLAIAAAVFPAVAGPGLADATGLRDWPGAPSAVAAAEDPLRLVGDARYVVEPENGRIHVVLTVQATNLKPPKVEVTPRGSLTTNYFYTSVSFGLQREASGAKATAAGATVNATTRKRTGYLELTVPFRGQLDYRETQKLVIEFDLAGGKPRSTSGIRVGSAYVTFAAWAWGDAGRASVKIELPSQFQADVTGSALTESRSGGTLLLTATQIGDPDGWYAVISADRPDGLLATRLELEDVPPVTIRSWPEDEEWGSRVAELLTDGLPALQASIGLDWPFSRLIATEIYTPLLEGYAGFYHPDSNEIEMGEELDDLVIVHEASHAWFHDRLFQGRWISEGLADAYASLVLGDLDRDVPEPDPVDPAADAAFPLNSWSFPGRIENDTVQAAEDYGYAASWTLTSQLVEIVGQPAMREVFQAATMGEIAYVGAGEPEIGLGVAYWRRYLDLLEERGGTDAVEPLFRTWVVAAGDLPELDSRDGARTAYADLLTAGHGWLPGYQVREPMTRWNFELAETRIADAAGFLEQRDALETRAAELALTPPGDLRVAYESATTDLDAARAIVAGENEALAAIESAGPILAAEPDLLTQVGLIGETPEIELVHARQAYEDGDAPAAVRAIASLRHAIEIAGQTGRNRVLLGLGIAWGVLFGLLVLVVVIRRLARRRRTRRALAAAALGPAFAVEAADAPSPTVGLDPAEPVEPAEPAELAEPAQAAEAAEAAEAAGYATLAPPATDPSDRGDPPDPPDPPDRLGPPDRSLSPDPAAEEPPS